EENRRAEADARLLQSLGAELVRHDGEPGFYEKILDAASRLMHSQFASMQAVETGDEGEPELRLPAHRGFKPRAARFWERVRMDSATTCAEALRTELRCVIPDVSSSALMKGTMDLVESLALGIRAVQTTPLVSRTGRTVGMLSTHWEHPYAPPE